MAMVQQKHCTTQISLYFFTKRKLMISVILKVLHLEKGFQNVRFFEVKLSSLYVALSLQMILHQMHLK